jgi:NAD dependent epimerase/dehydratase
MVNKILVTGAAGFIGSHLVEGLVKDGFAVKAFVRYNSKNNWGWLERIDILNEIEVITGDIRDYDSVYKALAGCSSVFHLAALIGIPYSYDSPKAYLETNIIGTYNILQASKELGLTSILTTSTSETYGTAQYVPIDEKHPLVGQSPYSASKIAADQLSISYYKSFNLPVKIIRPFNTYGPRQSARAVIPTIIIQILSGKKEIKLGNLSPTRDLTFVKDTIGGFIEIFKSEKLYGEIINIGMKQEISIENLAKLLGKIMNTEVEYKTEDERIRPDKSEVQRLMCDNSKIIMNTNWEPKYSLEKGLDETVEWIKQNLHIYKEGIYNV